MKKLARCVTAALAVILAGAAVVGSAVAQEKPRYGGELIFPVPSEPPGIVSDGKGQYEVVEVVEAPDPYTVRFRLKWPAASFLASVASPWNWIYKADLLAKDPHWYETHVMGTGPFLFVEHVKGSHWVGKKNPNYWDKGKPYLDGYRALFIKSTGAQVAAVRGERAHIQFRCFT